MAFSEQLTNDIKTQTKKNAVLQRKLDRELDKESKRYRKWAAKDLKQGNDPITIIAEGDSWGRYVIGKALPFYISKLMGLEILNLSSPGDETRDMMAPKQRKRLVRELKRGPAPGKKYKFMFFSGGGNDLTGSDRFHKWLNPFKSSMSVNDVLNQTTIDAALLLVKLDYQELIGIRDKHSPKTHLLFHGYDFAIPTGKGVCGKGPWLRPGLEIRKVPEAMHADVVKAFLIQFNDMLKDLAQKHGKISVIQSQGTLAPNEWANELHPKNVGFKKIARKFVNEIKALS
jgi:hypothetical protein